LSHIFPSQSRYALSTDYERYECKDCIGYPLCGGSSCVLATNIIRAGICENKQRIADYIEGIVVYNDLTNNYIEIA